jgi:hypothetical protein
MGSMADTIWTNIVKPKKFPDVFTIGKGGSETQERGLVLSRNGDAVGIQAVRGQKVWASINREQVAKFEDILCDDATSPSTYQNVKNKRPWKEFYSFQMRNVNYISRDGTESIQVKLTGPCRQCGVVLPDSLLTIDHQRAQAGDKLAPVYTLFRAIGYSQAAPPGPKGQQYRRLHAADIGGELAPGGGLDELNYPGMIVYSLFKGAGYYDNLKELSMHHFINLRPVCLFCNSSLGKH